MNIKYNLNNVNNCKNEKMKILTYISDYLGFLQRSSSMRQKLKCFAQTSGNALCISFQITSMLSVIHSRRVFRILMTVRHVVLVKVCKPAILLPLLEATLAEAVPWHCVASSEKLEKENM